MDLLADERGDESRVVEPTLEVQEVVGLSTNTTSKMEDRASARLSPCRCFEQDQMTCSERATCVVSRSQVIVQPGRGTKAQSCCDDSLSQNRFEYHDALSEAQQRIPVRLSEEVIA